MVRVLGLTAALAAGFLSSANAFESVPIDSFDYQSLKADGAQLLRALENSGIVAIKNIPGYAELRQTYLKVATECVSSPAARQSGGLSYRTLNDGTERVTISTDAHFNNRDATQTEVDCPAYLPTLRAFDGLVDSVALEFAQALDSTIASTGVRVAKEDKLETIVRQGEHLDHFHAYSSPEAAKPRDASDELSLHLHTDNGVAIFMTAPQFHKVDAETKSVEAISSDDIVTGPAASAGLVIELPETGERVQPILNEDELVVMIGEGLSSWISAGVDINPVLHGMQMPQFHADHGKVMRSWFGRMHLLQKNRIMKNTQMSFEEFSNKTAEFVSMNRRLMESDFASVACPHSRQLQASDETCAYRRCSPIGQDATDEQWEQCAKTCNSSHGDGSECDNNCICEDELGDGIKCWMLCLPVDQCSSDETPQCVSGKQEVSCVWEDSWDSSDSV